MKRKRSFFEKITGIVKMDNDFDDPLLDADEEEVAEVQEIAVESEPEAPAGDAELAVDVYETPNEIVIKTMVAGVRAEDLDIAVGRDTVTIRGQRTNERITHDHDYFHHELYWGSFSRTIVLPSEVDIEGADATEKHGLLIIRLPKIDKNKHAKIRIKSVN